MGMRMVTIMLFILSLNTSAMYLELSGMNDHMGVSPHIGVEDEIEQFDKAGETFESAGTGIGDYLGFTVAAVTYFAKSFVLLGATEGAFLNVGFPRWLVFPIMNFILRPIWTWGGIQMIRGVVFE